MEKEEIVKEGSDWNNTKLQEVINSITDDNFEFKGDYIISWKIIKKINPKK